MHDKITKFPISFTQRRKNMLGPLIVECQVSGRYLKFHEQSDIVNDSEFISVDVMAMPSESDQPSRKICGLIITRQDLLEALNHISPKEN